MNFEWNRRQIEKLIDLYKQKSELWDPKDDNYHLKHKKHDAWRLLASEMGCELSCVKSKVASLLSSYRREKGKMKKSGKGRGRVYKSKWFAFKLFDFLKNKETTSNTISAENIPHEEDSRDDSLHNFLLEANETLIADQSRSDNVAIHTRSNEEDLCRSNFFVAPNRLQIEGRMHVHPKLAQNYNVVENSHGDECTTFGEHIASKLRKFSEQQRSVVMHRISCLIFDEEMKLYSQQQYVNNSSSCSISSSLGHTPQCSPSVNKYSKAQMPLSIIMPGSDYEEQSKEPGFVLELKEKKSDHVK